MKHFLHLSDQGINEYFYSSLFKNCQKNSLELSDATHVYLVNIALRFLSSDELFLHDSNGRSLPTLAFLYRDALAAESVTERKNLIRSLGDTALFLAACFPNIWQHRGLGKKYFVAMGESAFDYLSAMDSAKQFPYTELSKKFEPIALSLGQAIFPEEKEN